MPIEKNAARTFAIRLTDASGTGVSGTPVVKISKDGAAAVAATNAPAAVSGLAAGSWTIALTAAEMNADLVTIEATLTGAVAWSASIYPEANYTAARAFGLNDVYEGAESLLTFFRLARAVLVGKTTGNFKNFRSLADDKTRVAVTSATDRTAVVVDGS